MKQSAFLAFTVAGAISSLAIRYLRQNSTNTYSNINDTSTSYANTQTKIKFLFIMGLEGTGHRFMTQLIEDSPNRLLFEELNITHSVKEMVHQLFGNLGQTPLFKLVDLRNADRADVQSAQMNLSMKMEEIASSISEWNGAALRTETINIPLNCIHGFMMSYPFMGGLLRAQHIPNIDLIYGACRMANVDCGHVFLHRNPAQILRSAQRRGFNEDYIHAMHLYTMALKTIITDLTRHASSTEACIGFFENNEDWKSAVRHLWGGTTANKADFATYIETAYNQPQSTNETLTLPDGLEPLVQLFVYENERAKRICQRGLELYKEHYLEKLAI